MNIILFKLICSIILVSYVLFTSSTLIIKSIKNSNVSELEDSIVYSSFLLFILFIYIIFTIISISI